MRRRVWIAAGLALGCFAEGCSTGPGEAPLEEPDVVDIVDDAMVDTDVGAALDGGSRTDAIVDRTAVVDVRVLDSGTRDAGLTDLGARDAGILDAGVRDTGVRDVGVPDVGVRDAGSTQDVGSLPGVGVALPAWDLATVAHVRQVRDRGVAMGNRVTVFAKIGDSITESGSFLSDVGFGWGSLGTYTALDPTIRAFRATALDRQDGEARNSFNRASVCATAGWTTSDALSGGTSSPLRRELAATRPAWAIVMYGTNDIDRGTVTTFSANLGTIVDIIEANGTVAVVSTIPDRNDGPGPAASALRFNEAIRTLTAARHIPLLDYWAAMQPLPSRGVSSDRIHPSVYAMGGSVEPAYFTAAGLQYGYNMRNLTAIQMLDRLRTLP